jgi:hypothetical protein
MYVETPIDLYFYNFDLLDSSRLSLAKGRSGYILIFTFKSDKITNTYSSEENWN